MSVMHKAPTTAEDLLALPIGPAFSSAMKVIDGKQMRVPVAPSVQATFVESHEIMGATDAEGQRWTLGQYHNGPFFRRRAV